jgi:cytidine deaminase
MPDRAASISDSTPQTELIIGLVAAVGIDLVDVVTKLRSVLSGFAYRCHDIHLTDQLTDLDWNVRLRKEPVDERIWSYMTAGDKLRARWARDDAFGLLAINAITLRRREESQNTRCQRAADGDLDVPLDRHAYIVRSLKRSEEARLLRDVYGSRFVQLSIYAPERARRKYLKRRIQESRVVPLDPRPKHNAQALINRDEKEAAKHGQDVRGIFHQGDFFVDATDDLTPQLQRTTEILFGHPQRTPTRDEFGMFQASAAARRSAELGRQVGAAICTKSGEVVVVGTNEVPRAGGGLYWERDPDDAREFKNKFDTSDRKKAEIARRIVKELRSSRLLSAKAKNKKIRQLIQRGQIGDLIEFSRAVHAEMAALMDAARRGIPVQNDVLYVTTFPCHHCARHIVAAGIKRVVYVAPYAKSLAARLHRDSIIVDPHPRNAKQRRVSFEPFVGVGPPRYLELFEMPTRKRPCDGLVATFEPKRAIPRLREIEPVEMIPEVLPYIHRELNAVELLESIQEIRGPSFR